MLALSPLSYVLKRQSLPQRKEELETNKQCAVIFSSLSADMYYQAPGGWGGGWSLSDFRAETHSLCPVTDLN